MVKAGNSKSKKSNKNKKICKNAGVKKFERTRSPMESLEHLNSYYGTDIAFDEKEIDLTKHRKSIVYLKQDMNRLTFEKCEKLSIILPVKDLSSFKPQMPMLRHLRFASGIIKYLNLNPRYYINLEILDLSNNEIAKAKDIESLRGLKKLNTLYLINNPIAKNEEEQEELQYRLPDVKIIYN